jgi:hypothetical protein
MSWLAPLRASGLGVGLVLFGLVLWIAFGRLLAASGGRRWPAVAVGLPPVLAGLAILAYWIAFFSSDRLAVVAHAVRLSAAHHAGAALTWLGVAWLLLSLWAVARAMRAPRP